MALSWHEPERALTLAERGLDFADAGRVFAGELIEEVDARFDYGEQRLVTIGILGARIVVVVWTWRGATRHIISMRKANDHEQRRYQRQLGRS